MCSYIIPYLQMGLFANVSLLGAQKWQIRALRVKTQVFTSSEHFSFRSNERKDWFLKSFSTQKVQRFYLENLGFLDWKRIMLSLLEYFSETFDNLYLSVYVLSPYLIALLKLEISIIKTFLNRTLDRTQTRVHVSFSLTFPNRHF